MQGYAKTNGIVVGQNIKNQLSIDESHFDYVRDADGTITKRYIFEIQKKNFRYTQYRFDWYKYLKSLPFIESDKDGKLFYVDPKEKEQNRINRLQNTASAMRIAFDADAVLFSDESEIIFKQKGLEKFHENEKNNVVVPLNEGPHAKLLKKLAFIQQKMSSGVELSPLRIAIVTARNSPSHMRVIKTLREWNVYVDEAFFLGGLPKDKILKAFNAHIFFDDQDVYLDAAKIYVPAARVPYKTNSILFDKTKLRIGSVIKEDINAIKQLFNNQFTEE